MAFLHVQIFQDILPYFQFILIELIGMFLVLCLCFFMYQSLFLILQTALLTADQLFVIFPFLLIFCTFPYCFFQFLFVHLATDFQCSGFIGSQNISY